MKQNALDAPAKPNGLAVLLGLNNTGKHVYAGTSAPSKVAARRAKNKVARKSRKGNR